MGAAATGGGGSGDGGTASSTSTSTEEERQPRELVNDVIDPHLRELVDDALHRASSIRTFVVLLGRNVGSLVRRSWREAARNVKLTQTEKERLVKAIRDDHTNPCLVANLHYHGKDLTTVRFGWSEHVTDAVVEIFAETCPRLTEISISLTGCGGDSTLRILAEKCPQLTSVSASSLPCTGAGATALARSCRQLKVVDFECCTRMTDDGCVVRACVRACVCAVVLTALCVCAVSLFTYFECVQRVSVWPDPLLTVIHHTITSSCTTAPSHQHTIHHHTIIPSHIPQRHFLGREL